MQWTQQPHVCKRACIQVCEQEEKRGETEGDAGRDRETDRERGGESESKGDAHKGPPFQLMFRHKRATKQADKQPQIPLLTVCAFGPLPGGGT